MPLPHKFFITVLFLLLFKEGTKAQETQTFSKLSPETVYLHLNTTVFFPGDYVHYSCYVLDRKTLRSSTTSKVAYITLINETLETIFEKTLFLTNGKATSDIFIGTNLPTGNYKLLAHTQWMRNGGMASFFKSDITIVNPYTTAKTKTNNSLETYGAEIDRNDQIQSQKPFKNTAPPLLEISMTSPVLGTRKEGQANITIKDPSLQKGSYSLSIRKAGSLSGYEPPNATALLPEKKEKARYDSILFIPELRGKILSGTIIKEEDNTAALSLALSVPGQPERFNIYRTDAEGRFDIVIPKGIENEMAFLDLLDQENAKLQLTPTPAITYDAISFRRFEVSPKMEKAILEKSVHNQIETSYFAVKPDSLFPTPKTTLLEKGTQSHFRLDDYTRFPTLRETIREIIGPIQISGANSGNRMRVRTPPSILFDTKDALVLLNGRLVKDHALLLDQSASDFEEIIASQTNLFFGKQRYQGVVLFNTKLPQTVVPVFKNDSKPVDIPTVQPVKKYFSPNYGSVDGSWEHVPDFRYQLLWNGDYVLRQKNNTISFTTSDITGTFEIVLEGFTAIGTPISERVLFTVE